MWQNGTLVKIGYLRFILDDTITNDHFDYSMAGICSLSCPFIPTSVIAIGIHPTWSIYHDRENPTEWDKEPTEGWMLMRLISDLDSRASTTTMKMDNDQGGYSHYGMFIEN